MESNINKAIEAIKKISATNFEGSIGSKVFAMSGCYGSGGEKISKLLAERLDLAIYNEDIITGIAKLTEADREAVKMVDDGIDQMSDFWLYRIINKKSFSHVSFKRHLINVVFSLARLGNCIIVGRGSHVILSNSAALRVRITSSESCCVERLMKELDIGKEEAKEKVKNAKKQRGKFLWKMFGSRLNDPTQFDITINTDRMTENDYEGIVDAIVAMYKVIGSKNNL